MTLSSEEQQDIVKSIQVDATIAELLAVSLGFICALEWAEEDPKRLEAVQEFLDQVDVAANEYLDSIE